MIVGFGQKQWMMLRVGVVSEALAVMRVLKLMLQAAATVELIGLAATHSRCRRSLFKASRCFVAGLRCGLARGFRQPALLQPTATPQRPPWAQALVGFRTNGFSMLTGRAANLPVAVCISPAAQCLKMSMIIVLPCCLIGSRTRRELAALGRRGLEGDLPSWMRRSTRSRRRDTSLQQTACTRH